MALAKEAAVRLLSRLAAVAGSSTTTSISHSNNSVIRHPGHGHGVTAWRESTHLRIVILVRDRHIPTGILDACDGQEAH